MALSCGLFDVDPDEAVLTKQLVYGSARVGPRSEDPSKCVILTNMEGEIQAWGLIDYRQGFSDAELGQAKGDLLNRLPEEVRTFVVIDSIQDEGFRDGAVGS